MDDLSERTAPLRQGLHSHMTTFKSRVNTVASARVDYPSRREYLISRRGILRYGGATVFASLVGIRCVGDVGPPIFATLDLPEIGSYSVYTSDGDNLQYRLFITCNSEASYNDLRDVDSDVIGNISGGAIRTFSTSEVLSYIGGRPLPTWVDELTGAVYSKLEEYFGYSLEIASPGVIVESLEG